MLHYNLSTGLQIPSVNDVPLQQLTSGSLVRYRCMVQDLFDPEFFLSTYETHSVEDQTDRRVCCSLYRDVVTCEVINLSLSLRRQLFTYGYCYKASCARLG